MENFNVFFTTKNLQLVYPPLWRGPFNENPYTKLRLGRSKFGSVLAIVWEVVEKLLEKFADMLGRLCGNMIGKADAVDLSTNSLQLIKSYTLIATPAKSY